MHCSLFSVGVEGLMRGIAAHWDCLGDQQPHTCSQIMRRTIRTRRLLTPRHESCLHINKQPLHNADRQPGTRIQYLRPRRNPSSDRSHLTEERHHVGQLETYLYWLIDWLMCLLKCPPAHVGLQDIRQQQQPGRTHDPSEYALPQIQKTFNFHDKNVLFCWIQCSLSYLPFLYIVLRQKSPH